MSTARPKSVTNGVPSARSRMLDGFRSRWMMLCRWASSTASATVRISLAARRGSNCRSRRINSPRSPPPSSDMVKNSSPSHSPAWNTATMFACRRLAIRAISPLNR